MNDNTDRTPTWALWLSRLSNGARRGDVPVFVVGLALLILVLWLARTLFHRGYTPLITADHAVYCELDKIGLDREFRLIIELWPTFGEDVNVELRLHPLNGADPPPDVLGAKCRWPGLVKNLRWEMREGNERPSVNRDGEDSVIAFAAPWTIERQYAPVEFTWIDGATYLSFSEQVIRLQVTNSIHVKSCEIEIRLASHKQVVREAPTVMKVNGDANFGGEQRLYQLSMSDQNYDDFFLVFRNESWELWREYLVLISGVIIGVATNLLAQCAVNWLKNRNRD